MAQIAFDVKVRVAPYVGAWIETLKTQKSYSDVLSHPTWVRGLKQRGSYREIRAKWVAPYVGAWIETSRCNLLRF